jgi:hypothetical protein
MGDQPRARRAADFWLNIRAADGDAEGHAA